MQCKRLAEGEYRLEDRSIARTDRTEASFPAGANFGGTIAPDRIRRKEIEETRIIR